MAERPGRAYPPGVIRDHPNKRDVKGKPANWTGPTRFEPGQNAISVKWVLARKCNYDQLIWVFCVQFKRFFANCTVPF